MNFEQVELQMDSVLHSLRQRFRRASVPSSSGGGAADSSVPSSPGPSAATTQLGSLPSSAAASPVSRRDRSAQQQKGLRRSLHSRASLRRLLRGRLFGDDEEEPASGSRAEAGSRGSGAQKEAEASRLPSEENMAWTAPVSPQSQARTLTPRRRNSARLRELQRLLRAYHEQREAWQSPPTSPRAPRRGQSSRSSGRQSRNESSAAESPQTPRMASTLSNGRESRLPPVAQPLHYSPFEMGTGHPLVFSGSPHLGGDWPMSPKLSAKRRPVVEARQRISLSQLELALRGGQQPEPVTVWSSTASSSPPLSSSLSPSPLLPPKPTAPSSREQRGPSPPILKSARKEWQGQKQQQAAEEEGRSASPQYFRRVQSPRPEVHFQQRVVPLGHSPLEYAQKPPPPPIAKERKQQKAAKETTKMKTAQQTGQQQTKASDGIATTAAAGSSSSNLFSPAGIQQLLFRHKRERGQSETREKKSAAKQQRSGTGDQGQAEDGRRSLLLVKQARSEPRLAGGGAARSSALSMRNSLASSLAGLSLSASTTALEHLERLKDRVTETKYVTAVFESRGGFGPVLEDVQTELEHWLGARSRLLAVACEVHWSVPERFRSRQLEIQLKESLHATLRENNRRILELNTSDVEDYPGLDDHQSWLRSRPTPFPMTLAKSRTEESCTRDAESDAFQGVYRRFYPALLSLQDEETVRAHQGYWSLENLTDGSRCPLVSNPGRFLWSAQPGQLARKSLVAVNMAVLRLRGDNFDYDKAANAEQKPTAVAKRKSIKQSFF